MKVAPEGMWIQTGKLLYVLGPPLHGHVEDEEAIGVVDYWHGQNQQQQGGHGNHRLCGIVFFSLLVVSRRYWTLLRAAPS